MLSRHRVSLGLAALLAPIVLFLPASARQSRPAAFALAPLEIVAQGLGHLRGIAVDETGAAFVADAKAGALLRVARDGSSAIVVEHLKRPGGVALDGESRLIVVETGRGRILRLETDGGVTALALGMRQPRWVGAAPDGHLYVTAKNLGFEDEDGDEDEGEPEMVVRVSPDGIAKVFADRFRGLQGVAVGEDALVVAARGRKGERHARGALYELPIQPDGRAGPVHPLGRNQFVGPAGLAIDRLGAHFVGAGSLPHRPWPHHVIVKVAQDGGATLFAEGLVDPRGLAFGPDGSLYLADGNSGRVLRFVAPRPPFLEEVPPAVTNQEQITLRLRAEVGARLTVLGGQFPVGAAVDGGSVTVSVPLHRNRENQLLAFATGSDGLGLTSAPLELGITQDEEPPTIELLAPRAGTLVRGTIAAEARAADMNGILDVEFRLDELMVGLDAAEPFRVGVDTRVAADGLRGVSALARDRAGNVGRASAPVTVDNTSPAVRIVAPAPGSVVNGPVEVVVEAVDATAGVAQVELVVNGVSRFVAEAPPYRFQLDLRELAPGANVLVVAAVDRAGNRGESTPVSVVLSGVTVEIGEPAVGAQVPAGLVLVRGRVEAGDAEVGVAVNGIPAAVQGTTFAALVPVAPDTTILTAVATTADGTMTSHSVTITVSPPLPQAITLLASPQSGVAPLTVRFSLPGTDASIALDFDGNRTVDFIGPTLDGQTFTYTVPGLYFPSVTITDAQGAQSTATTIVNVLARGQMDALFRAKWNAMKTALIRNDIEGAILYFTPEQRLRFRTLFTALSAQIAQIAQDMRDIELIYLVENQAKYRLPRTQLYGGQPVTLTYYVYFIQDDAGFWSIESF